ncbi:16S rRNA (guanine(527)-N(7))-methyltransferase RsmG [sulfur-oxidizing endosymbiont of Gigantopelta aegis]|uniref:16S rRNA (guanine(527)-N(7))-methyltransferase RsmG n=1 Tax=sulfur-oxidizing endosymbiont of Gigantopelta aegis TaxID=2794934 RepID=UPI0018DCC25C
MNPDLSKKLADGLQVQGQTIGLKEQQQLIQFVELMVKWNKVYNLTSIRRAEEMITLHLLDSLVMLPFFTQQDNKITTILDVGTGGGIPGIPLALCLPEIDFVLLDARGKKVRFIQTAIAQLGLKNVTAVHARVEDYQRAEEEKFACIISRAFASLEDMLNYCQHLSAKQGRFFAMKGQIPEEEIAQLPEGFRIEAIDELKVAGLNAQRHLIQIAFSE